MKKLFTLFSLLAMFAFAGCESFGGDDVVGGSYSIGGAIQKGPFVQGATITIQALNPNLKPTGQMYTTFTTNDAGMFELGEVNSRYVELIANGYYFDEVLGSISAAPLTLRSIVNLDEGTNTNVNLLTTLVYGRIKNLVEKEDKNVAEATMQAEQELYLAFGIPKEEHPGRSSSELNIAEQGEGNGLLIAISVVLQCERNVGELSEIIAKLSSDLADDGKISPMLISSIPLRENYYDIVENVKTNLINRYNSLGVEGAISAFDTYFNLFDDVNGNGLVDGVEFAILESGSIELSPLTQIFTLPLITSTNKCEIVLEDGIDWVSIQIEDGVCEVEVTTNDTGENREAVIYLKDLNSDESIPFIIKQNCGFAIEYTYDPTVGDGEVWMEVWIDDEHPFWITSYGCEYADGKGVFYVSEAPSIFSCALNISGKITSITIPESIESIREDAFVECQSLEKFYGKFASEDGRCLIIDGCLKSFAPAGLTEYVIPEGVTSIGHSAFHKNSNLTSISIPDSVTEIGEGAFEDCSSLTSIIIPDRVTAIEGRAFRNCTSLTTITIPDSVTRTGYGVFSHCSNLESVYCKPTTPPSINNIFFGDELLTIYVPIESVDAYKAAEGWNEYADKIVGYDFLLQKPIIPNNQIWYSSSNGNSVQVNRDDITTFGANIVSNTYSNGNGIITFDDSVTSIGDYAFSNCTSLISVSIPDSVTKIGKYAFNNCTSLTSIDIPNGVTSIGDYAFEGCTSLTSVSIPDGVTSIGDYAFSNCTSLTSIDIPNGVTSIGNNAFSDCTSLTSIDIPNGVTSIGFRAFWRCTSLTSITIPDGVTQIGEVAFGFCESLTSVTIPDSVISIGVSAFACCLRLAEFSGKFASNDGRCLIVDGVLKSFAPAGLTEYTIPDSVTQIGIEAFYDCTSLTSVSIPDGVTFIGDYAFYDCTSLTSVYCEPTTPPRGNDEMFSRYNDEYVSVPIGCTIYVPTESVEAYKVAEGWNEYADKIVGYDFE